MKKKMNSYLKFFLILLACTIGGAVLGAASMMFGWDALIEEGGSALNAVGILQKCQAPVYILVLIASVGSGELILHKIKAMGRQMSQADDEECDVLEYQIERIGSIGVILSNVFLIGCMMLLSIVYSESYFESLSKGELKVLLLGMIVFIAECIYEGVWQVHYVKIIQEIWPEKKGDPSSAKFQKQWLESCDEAEKEMIYQSSYTTYIKMGKVMPMLACIGMFCHLIWDTGAMAVVLVCAAWLFMVVTYCRSCVKKKGQNLNGNK